MTTPYRSLKDKLISEGKERITSIANDYEDARGVVFGTFNKTYPVTAIEREREDGVTLINLSPECRVFICGAEVTKDVVSVDTNYDDAANGSCTITLSNPRGKYNVDITDLIGEKNKGRWREDKDILEIYNYEWLEKQNPRIRDDRKLVRTLKMGSTSSIISAAFDQIGRNYVDSDIINSINFLKSRTKDKTLGVTRMLYEIKHHSNMSKKAGEIIFDFRDPIYIFFKGRFSSYWYFGFSGVLSGIDHSKTYSSSDTITIQGADPLYIYKRRKYTDKGSLMRSGSGDTFWHNYANRGDKTEKGEPGPFNTIVKVMFFLQNPKQMELIENSHFYYTSANTFTDSTNNPTPPYNTSSSSTNYQRYMDVFRKAHEFKANINPNQLYEDGMMFREFPLRSVSSGLLSSVTDLVASGAQLISTTIDLTNSALNMAMNPASLIPTSNTGVMYGVTPFSDLTNNELAEASSAVEEGVSIVGGKVLNTLDSKLQTASKVTTIDGKITDAVAKQIGIHAGNSTNYQSWFKKDKPYLADPDCFNLGPWNDIYLQYNEIQIEEFNEENIKPFYDTSVRYWTKDYSLKTNSDLISQTASILVNEANEKLDELTGQAKLGTVANNIAKSLTGGDMFKSNIDIEKTGWECKSGFGVCGIHPALTYEFINNFHRVKDVYDAAINERTGKPELLDSIVVSPYEKLKEMVLGSPTEISTVDSSKKLGTQRNYFRPRLFFLWPKKFRKRDKSMWSVAQLLLTDEDITTSYDAIEKLTNDEEYCVYCSPMGDIFIEPIMYDFHPTKFYNKIESRDPVYDTKDIYFRNFMKTTSGEKVVYRRDKAYFFNTKANHPLFITQKDTTRVTESITPEMLRTSVEVQGNMTGGDGLQQEVLSGIINTMKHFSIHERLEKNPSDKNSLSFQTGMYFANGLPNDIMNLSAEEFRKKLRITSRVNELLGSYEATLLSTLLRERSNHTIFKLISETRDSAIRLSKEPSKKFAHADVATVYSRLKSDYNNLSLADKKKYQVENAANPFNNLTLEHWILISTLCPSIFTLIDYFSKKDKKSTSSTVALSDALRAFINTYNIESAVSLGNMTIEDICTAFKALERAGSSQPVVSSSDTRTESTQEGSITRQLTHLYEVQLLVGSSASSYFVQAAHDEVSELTEDQNSFPILTRGILKQLERIGLYNPNADYVSKFGSNPGPVIYNSAITNGPEAVIFAKSLFNRLTSQAYTFNVDLIGRPEFWLNRPHYLEDKYSIGLLTSYSIRYGIEEPFTSTAVLSYLRRNAITYSYTLDELDVVANPTVDVMSSAIPGSEGIKVTTGDLTSTLSIPETDEIFNAALEIPSAAALSPTSDGMRKFKSSVKSLKEKSSESIADSLTSAAHSNSYFNEKALKYFQQLGTINKLKGSVAGATDEFFNTGGFSNGWISPGSGVVGQTIANSVALYDPIISGNPYSGGLYVAHDCIGHLDYNESVYAAKTDTSIMYNKGTTQSSEIPFASKKLGQDLLSEEQAVALQNKMIEVHSKFKDLQAKEELLEKLLDRKEDLENTTIPKYEEDQTEYSTKREEAEKKYNNPNSSSSEKRTAAKDKAKYQKLYNEISSKLLNARVQLSSMNSEYTKMVNEHTALGKVIYGSTAEVTFDTTGKKRSVAKVSSPYVTKNTTENSLLKELYVTIPEISAYNTKTEIRKYWGVLDDRDLLVKGTKIYRMTGALSEFNECPVYLEKLQTKGG